MCIRDRAITDAEKNSSNAKVGYIEIPTQNLVVNRLVDKAGKVDDKLRVITVSYTHLDVYKRQGYAENRYCFIANVGNRLSDYYGTYVFGVEC